MVDFKVLVKVAKTHELDTLRTLGNVVEGNEEAFFDVEPQWVAKQDFITAVPVEIALTMEVRNALMAKNPNCRFIVTGVPAERVKTLVEKYGYTVAHTDITEVDLNESRKEKEEVTGTEQPAKEVASTEYFVNGKPVSADEFNERVANLINEMQRFGKDFFGI